MHIIRFGALAIVGLMAGFTLSSGGIQNGQDGNIVSTSSIVSFGIPDALADRSNRGNRQGNRSGNRDGRSDNRSDSRDNRNDNRSGNVNDRQDNRQDMDIDDRVDRRMDNNVPARRVMRRTARRVATLPANCTFLAPYHQCGSVYYEPVQEDGTTVYIVVTP